MASSVAVWRTKTMLKMIIIPAETKRVQNITRPKTLRCDLFKTMLILYIVPAICRFFNSCSEVTVALKLTDSFSMTNDKVFFGKIGGEISWNVRKPHFNCFEVKDWRFHAMLGCIAFQRLFLKVSLFRQSCWRSVSIAHERVFVFLKTDKLSNGSRFCIDV